MPDQSAVLEFAPREAAALLTALAHAAGDSGVPIHHREALDKLAARLDDAIQNRTASGAAAGIRVLSGRDGALKALIYRTTTLDWLCMMPNGTACSFEYANVPTNYQGATKLLLRNCQDVNEAIALLNTVAQAGTIFAPLLPPRRGERMKS